MSKRLEKLWSDECGESCSDEFLEFDRVKEKLSNRPDLHAFILLDKLCPGNDDIISASSHDEFYFSIEPYDLCEAATDEQLIDLHRCGVRYDSDNDCLCMFS